MSVEFIISYTAGSVIGFSVGSAIGFLIFAWFNREKPRKVFQREYICPMCKAEYKTTDPMRKCLSCKQELVDCTSFQR